MSPARRGRAVSETAPHVRLTVEQVQAIVRAAQEGGADSVLMLLPGLLSRQALPPAAVWEQRMHGEGDLSFSLSLVRGLLLLARLVDGRPARLKDLAQELNISPSTTSRYLRTLVLVGLVEREPGTWGYRLVR
jgi:hypothetical protein